MMKLCFHYYGYDAAQYSMIIIDIVFLNMAIVMMFVMLTVAILMVLMVAMTISMMMQTLRGISF